MASSSHYLKKIKKLSTALVQRSLTEMQTEFENCSAQLDGMSTGHQSVRPSSVTSATFEKIGVPQSTRKGGQADSAKLIWLAEGPTLTILESRDSALVGKWTLSLPNFDSAQIHCVTDFNMGKRGTWFLVSALLTRNAEIRSTQQPILALIDPLRPSVPVTWKTIAQVVTTLARNPANKGASSQRPDTVICGTAVGEIFEICIPTADLIAEPAIVVHDRPGNALTSIRVVEDKGICVVGYADGRVQVRSLKDSWKLLHEERHSGRVMHMALQVAPTPNDNVEEEKKDQQEETATDPAENGKNEENTNDCAACHALGQPVPQIGYPAGHEIIESPDGSQIEPVRVVPGLPYPKDH